ncbi:hypothetical protein SA286_14700 [Bacillus altitudinis]|uniref:hypothetical protein n=1 Tax=Bacillus altitudinis TaxID=293387 RepID=UPI001F6104B5|nr:hypothetical protein [Bacillus altitudinis]WRO25166.1 hypothetical protein SA286_14700 [Bacillus altitudinis]
MKIELIEQAYNIPDFDNQATELTIVLDKIRDKQEDKNIIHLGYKLALNMIPHDGKSYD